MAVPFEPQLQSWAEWEQTTPFEVTEPVVLEASLTLLYEVPSGASAGAEQPPLGVGCLRSMFHKCELRWEIFWASHWPDAARESWRSDHRGTPSAMP